MCNRMKCHDVCHCWPSVVVSWTYEITVDDLYSKFYLQNYKLYVTKNVLKCQKVRYTTTTRL